MSGPQGGMSGAAGMPQGIVRHDAAARCRHVAETATSVSASACAHKAPVPPSEAHCGGRSGIAGAGRERGLQHGYNLLRLGKNKVASRKNKVRPCKDKVGPCFHKVPSCFTGAGRGISGCRCRMVLCCRR